MLASSTAPAWVKGVGRMGKTPWSDMGGDE
jgi:hypothetical protein